MEKGKQNLYFIIISILSILLTIVFLWGYNNYLKMKELVQTNQDLMRSLRLRTSVKSSITLKEGDHVPDFTIETTNSQNISLSQNAQLLLIFIDTSCSACVKFLMDTYDKVRKFQDAGLIIVAVGLGSEDTLKEFEKKMKLPIYFAQDLFAKLHRKFGIKGYPSLVYIENGIVRIIADPFTFEKRTQELINFLKNEKNT